MIIKDISANLLNRKKFNTMFGKLFKVEIVKYVIKIIRNLQINSAAHIFIEEYNFATDFCALRFTLYIIYLHAFTHNTHRGINQSSKMLSE